MTPDDRKLLEALCVAMAGGLMADPDVDPRTVRWSGIADAASDALSAIRAAEGEEARAPTQSVRTIGGGKGTARDLTAEDTINVLRQELQQVQIANVVMRQRWELDQSALDAAESIIHALCDERASRRSHHRAMATVLRSYLREPTKSPKVLPAGHVPERLMVGMLVEWPGSGDARRVTRTESNGLAYGNTVPPLGHDWPIAQTDRRGAYAENVKITLAEPFALPESDNV